MLRLYDWWNGLVTSVPQTLRVMGVVLGLVFLVVVFILVLNVCAVWSKFSKAGKASVLLITAFIGLVIALLTGFIGEDQLIGVWNAYVDEATHIWMRFDGWARTNQWVGALMLALLVLLFWPSQHDERN